MKTKTEALTYTIESFCQSVGIGRTKAYELLNSGEIDAVRIGRRTLITVASVHALLDRARTTANPQERR